MTTRLIQTVRLQRNDRTVVAEFSPAIPAVDSTYGSISVLSGRNCTGKTHILQKIAIALTNRRFFPDAIDTGIAVSVELQQRDGNQPTGHFLQHLPFSNVRAGNQEAKRLHHNLKELKQRIYRSAIAEFLLRQIDSEDQVIDAEKWVENDEYRWGIVADRFSNNDYYLCRQDDPLVKAIQDSTGHALFYTRRRSYKKPDLDVALWYGGESFLDLSRWSHGQQHLFVCMLEIAYICPDILLIDEPESHMHPEFITHLMQFARSRCRQIICVTHHPHVMFSQSVDSVFFISCLWQKSTYLPPVIRASRPNFAPDIITVESIDEDFQKITRAHELFAHADSQLLHLAGAVESDLESHFFADIVKSFSNPSEDVKPGIYPDAQTTQLVGILRQLQGRTSTAGYHILDFGAGVGRVEREMRKLGESRVKHRLNWFLYEPRLSHVSRLAKELEDASNHFCFRQGHLAG